MIFAQTGRRPPALKIRCRVPALGMMAILLGGCQGLSYYAQAVVGQMDLLARRRPVAELLADPDIDPLLKSRLGRVADLRTFAAGRLHLPVNGVTPTSGDPGTCRTRSSSLQDPRRPCSRSRCASPSTSRC